MDMLAYQKFISDVYKRRGWYQYDAFIRANFLNEEVGEVCRAIRTIEIGRDRPDEERVRQQEGLENLAEELGDVLANILILADTYHLSLAEIMEKHQKKILDRYGEHEN